MIQSDEQMSQVAKPDAQNAITHRNFDFNTIIEIGSFQNEAIQIFDHLRVILILGRPPQHAVPSNRPSATSRRPAILTQGHFRGGVRE